MRTVIFPSDKQASYEAYGYSAAVKSGGFLFVSGQVGVDSEGNAELNPEAQFNLAFSNLEKVLEAAGCGFEDVVDVTSYHVDMFDHFDEFAAVKTKVFPEAPYPNWTSIGVVTLADQSLLLEVKVVARLR